jgi:hypothetical protein
MSVALPEFIMMTGHFNSATESTTAMRGKVRATRSSSTLTASHWPVKYTAKINYPSVPELPSRSKYDATTETTYSTAEIHDLIFFPDAHMHWDIRFQGLQVSFSSFTSFSTWNTQLEGNRSYGNYSPNWEHPGFLI